MKMVGFPKFVFLQPVFLAFIVALVILLFIIMFQRKQLITGFSLFFILSICFIISGITLWMSGFIVDEYNLAGDERSFYMFLGIIVLCIVNAITGVTKGSKLKRT